MARTLTRFPLRPGPHVPGEFVDSSDTKRRHFCMTKEGDRCHVHIRYPSGRERFGTFEFGDMAAIQFAHGLRPRVAS